MLSCMICHGIVSRYEEYCPRCGNLVIPNALRLEPTTLIYGDVILVITWRTLYGVPLGQVKKEDRL